MSFKVRKRLKVFPGFHINFSKSAMSATIGIKGLSINTGNNGTYLNVNIPGVGISNRIQLNNRSTENPDPDFTPKTNLLDYSVQEIKSYEPEILTSEGLFGLKESILNAEIEKRELKIQARKDKIKKILFQILHLFSFISIFGLFYKGIKSKYEEYRELSKESQASYEAFSLRIEFTLETPILNDYLVLKKSFDNVSNVDRIWDITTTQNIDRVKSRSAASAAITRERVNFKFTRLDFIDTEYDALYFKNANGADLYLYPGFAVIKELSRKEFGILDLRELKIKHNSQRFLETDYLPKDSPIVDRTWTYVNKDGRPDRRFKNNTEIPILQYYELFLLSKSGLNEAFSFSNPDAGRKFCESLANYLTCIGNLNWKLGEPDRQEVVL